MDRIARPSLRASLAALESWLTPNRLYTYEVNRYAREHGSAWAIGCRKINAVVRKRDEIRAEFARRGCERL